MCFGTGTGRHITQTSSVYKERPQMNPQLNSKQILHMSDGAIMTDPFSCLSMK